jgi:hypothetical protein
MPVTSFPGYFFGKGPRHGQMSHFPIRGIIFYVLSLVKTTNDSGERNDHGHVKVSEVHDSRHGESRLECGGLPPLWARPFAGALWPEASLRPESGSKLPHSICRTLTQGVGDTSRVMEGFDA